MHLELWQRLNHFRYTISNRMDSSALISNSFRNGRELCRKDLMAKNIKKKRRSLEKEGRVEEATAYEFIPQTFLLP